MLKTIKLKKNMRFFFGCNEESDLAEWSRLVVVGVEFRHLLLGEAGGGYSK